MINNNNITQLRIQNYKPLVSVDHKAQTGKQTWGNCNL